VLLVTHSLALVERFCDEALWIDGGLGRAHGDPRRVVGAYITDVEKSEERALAAADAKAHEHAESQPIQHASVSDPVAAADSPDDGFRAAEGRWGSRDVEITAVRLLGEDGIAGHVFHSGEPVTIELSVTARQPVTDFAFGIGLFSADGVCCYGTNTDVADLKSVELSGSGTVRFVIDSLDLVEGTYKLDVAAHKRDGFAYDYHRQLYTFRVKSRTKDAGIYRPRHRWEFSPSVRVTPGGV